MTHPHWIKIVKSQKYEVQVDARMYSMCDKFCH